MIIISEIDINEVARYLGNSNVKLNDAFKEIFDQCKPQLLSSIKVRYNYKIVELEGSGLLLGNDIKAHLKNCSHAIVIGATLGADVDRLIRRYQAFDMAQAVVMDSMASVAIESVMDKIEQLVASEYRGKNFSWRFSPGYGDYPISLQEEFLRIIDAQRKIGLCVSDSMLLTPTKSVTAIIGISDLPFDRKRRGCATCNLAGSCKFRKAGVRCDG